MTAYSFKERFIAPIEVGLGREITGPSSVDFPAAKLQTIRAHGKRRHARAGEILHLYYAMRTKQCRLIGVAKCVDAVPVTLEFGSIKGYIGVTLNGARLHRRQVDLFARSDGFDTVDDMRAFWLVEHPDVAGGVFDGVVVRWEPINGEP